MISDISEQTYSGGQSITPNIIVKYGEISLTKGIDYTVSYSNNIYVGTATVTIAGEGNYTGTASKTFTINKATQSAPEKPSKDNAIITPTSVTLQAITTSGQGNINYGCSTENNASNVTNWQTELTFEDLTPNTTYYFFAKYVGNDNYKEAVSEVTEIKTLSAYKPLSVEINTSSSKLTVNYLPVFADNSVPENIIFAHKNGEAYTTIETTKMSDLIEYANTGTLYYAGSGTLVTVRSVNNISWNETFKADSATSYPYYALTTYANLQAGIKAKIENDGTSEAVEKVAMETSGTPNDKPEINGVLLKNIYNAYNSTNSNEGFGGGAGLFWTSCKNDANKSWYYYCRYGLATIDSISSANYCVLISRTFNQN